jgi:hypothetical protein
MGRAGDRGKRREARMKNGYGGVRVQGLKLEGYGLGDGVMGLEGKGIKMLQACRELQPCYNPVGRVHSHGGKGGLLM